MVGESRADGLGKGTERIEGSWGEKEDDAKVLVIDEEGGEGRWV